MSELPRLSVEEFIERASNDRAEEVLELPEIGGSVKIRALSAAHDDRINEQSAEFGNNGKTKLSMTTMSRLRFQYGVVEPSFTAEQVKKLHIESGPTFQRVVKRINELSGLTEKDSKEAEAAFPEAGGPADEL